MGKFDLNNPVDFARATSSFGANVIGAVVGAAPQDWLIEEGKYTSGIPGPFNSAPQEMIFHVFTSAKDYGGAVNQISDTGGRRKAKFEFPFLDGQLTNDMGREAENFTIEILLHGNNYLAAFKALLNILNEPTPGLLTHPVRGPIRCGMEHYELIHQESQRKAVAIRLTMTEHSLEALLAINGKNPTKSAPTLLSKLTAAFVKFENAINTVQGQIFLAQSVKLQITQGLQTLTNSFSKVVGNMNATFNPGGNIPALLPTQGGGLQSSSGAIVTNSVTNVISPTDPFGAAPPDLLITALQVALAVDHIEKDIEAVRFQISQSILALETAGNNQGALAFYSNIIDLRQTANDLQDAFEAGKQSSQVRIVDYTTPQDMSIREVAFANGILPDDSNAISFLNPDLDSFNFIPKGTVVKVAIGE
jgi:hypothetical protein